jgi:hypothetical protein
VAKKRVHRIPHEAVREILIAHGISTVNRAIEWGDTAGSRSALISGKSVEGILRGKRVLGVEFERVDAILCALDAPHHWYMELAPWYYPPGVRHEADYETFLAQRAAFERACQMFEGLDASLLFG